MNSELFPASIVTVKSPRLRWMERHKLITQEFPDVKPGDECPETGNPIHRWEAWQVGAAPCGGPTEDDAIIAWAKANGVRLWNEEGV